MTVIELIAKLQEYEPEMLVVIDGYEGGLDNIKEVKTTHLIENMHDGILYGRHEHVDVTAWDFDEEYKDKPVIKAVYLPRPYGAI